MSRFRRILLAVSGLNPQVITETLYCLHGEGRMVDEIHCITTRQGRDTLLAALMDGGTGPLYRFCVEYGAEVPYFPAENIHVPLDSRGRELGEILGQDDNEALLKLCLRLTAEFTADPDTAVYFLVAGGRKTMTSCLSFAAQMYGRPQDRIYHVLVPPEFESCRDFWYPPRTPRLLELRDKAGIPFLRSTSHAVVRLLAVPFLPLRGHIERSAPELLATPPDSSGGLLTALVRDEERVFVISPTAGCISCGPLGMDMHPARLALLTFFCEKRLVYDQPPPGDDTSCPPWFLGIEEIFACQRRLTALYEAIRGRKPGTMSSTGITNLNANNFNSYKSRIRRELVKHFGAPGEQLAIRSWGTRPHTRYGLIIERRRLQLKW